MSKVCKSVKIKNVLKIPEGWTDGWADGWADLFVARSGRPSNHGSQVAVMRLRPPHISLDFCTRHLSASQYWVLKLTRKPQTTEQIVACRSANRI